MLNLDSWIHFQEIEFSLGISQEFECCKAAVSYCFRTFDDLGSDSFPSLIIQPWPLFQYLLMTSLYGAKALAEMDCVFPIAENLEFNVLCFLYVLLNKNSAVSKG